MRIFQVIQSKLEAWSEKVDKKDSLTRNKYTNNESIDQVLSIPLIGGFIYIYKKYSQARYINSKLKREYEDKINLRLNIKSINTVKDTIRQEITSALESNIIKTFSVPEEYMYEFISVTEEFPFIQFVDKGDNKFLAIRQDMEL